MIPRFSPFFFFPFFPKEEDKRTHGGFEHEVEEVRAAFNTPGYEVCDSGRFHRRFIRTVYSIHENIQNFYLQFSISWPRNEEESLEPGGLKKRERERFENVERTPPLAQQRPMTSIEITQPRYCFLSAPLFSRYFHHGTIPILNV